MTDLHVCDICAHTQGGNRINDMTGAKAETLRKLIQAHM
jgi:hypothetical protein